MSCEPYREWPRGVTPSRAELSAAILIVVPAIHSCALRELAREAGFGDVRSVPWQHPLKALYGISPTPVQYLHCTYKLVPQSRYTDVLAFLDDWATA